MAPYQALEDPEATHIFRRPDIDSASLEPTMIRMTVMPRVHHAAPWSALPPLPEYQSSEVTVVPRRSPYEESADWRVLATALVFALVCCTVGGLMALHMDVVQISLGPNAPERVSAAAPAPMMTGSISAMPAHDGISLYVDGKPYGFLPATVAGLTVGEHTVRFEAGDNFRAHEETIDIVGGRTLDMGRISLELLRGSVTVDVDDGDAQVWCRSSHDTWQIKGPFPRTVELDPGDYQVVVSKYGFRSQIRAVRVDALQSEATVEVDSLLPKNHATRDIREI